MIRLTPTLVTSYHRALATPEWLTSAAAYVESRVRDLSFRPVHDGDGELTALYNEERDMAPGSGVRHKFEVAVRVSREPGTPPGDRYEALLEFDPKARTFRWTMETFTTAEERVKIDEGKRKRAVLESVSLENLSGRAEFEQLRCPECDGRLALQVYPEGKSWAFWCAKDPMHHYSSWRPARLEPGGWWSALVADRRCSKCKTGDQVAGILYGLIADPSRIDRKVWELGGCMVSSELWHCRGCDLSFLR